MYNFAIECLNKKNDSLYDKNWHDIYYKYNAK